MNRILLASALVAFSFAANADPYPSTLSSNEKERHEFYDVQRENYPSGPMQSLSDPETTGSISSRSPVPYRSSNPMIQAIPSWVNDKPVTYTTP